MKTDSLPQLQTAASHELSQHYERDHIDQPYDVPDSQTPTDDPDDDFDAGPDDDTRWEVFLPDDEEHDPDLSDFEGNIDPEAWNEERE